VYVYIDNNYDKLKDKISVLAVLVLVLVLVSVVQATNLHHLNPHHQALVLLVATMHHLLLAVLLVVQAATNQHHSLPVDMVLVLVLVLALLLVELSVDHLLNPHLQTSKSKNMLPMLKVSSLIKTHKSSVVQLLVVYKHTHKTSKFDFSNHHLYHPQA
jgi:hypothetical protein